MIAITCLRMLPALLWLLPMTVLASWPTVPLPENSRGEVVSSHMNYNGVDMRASRFATALPLKEVVGFYAEQWRGKHVVDRHGHKTIVGHADGNYYVTVELEPGGGGTEGTIGIIRMPDDPRPPTLGEGVFRPAGTTVVSDIRYLDTATESRTLVMENQLSPYINRQHYAQRLPAQGWRSVDSGSCKPSSSECVARFEKPGGEKMVMTMTRGESNVTATVVNVE